MRLRLLLAAVALSLSACQGGSLGESCTQGSNCSSGYCAFEPDQSCSPNSCEGTCACAPGADGGACEGG